MSDSRDPAAIDPCLSDRPPPSSGALAVRMEALGDAEGARIPDGLPPVIDAHVHLFPDPVFAAIWRWFDEHGWPIRYKLLARDVIAFQLSRGVERIVALHYAHKPGIARGMNAFVADLCREEPRVVGLATVFPGEPDAVAILEDAFAAGLGGIKLHCHVQCVGPDDPALHDVYATCARLGKPLVMHAGREPKSPAYKCDPHRICSVDRVERVLRDHPRLKLVVPHLGADETDAYLRLVERYDTLWLDTTMAVADFFRFPLPPTILTARPERILYGTDFPNVPYAWDRELKKLCDGRVSEEQLEWILGKTARALFVAPEREEGAEAGGLG